MELTQNKGKTCRYCKKYFKYSLTPNRLHLQGICTTCQIALHRLYAIKGWWLLKYKINLPLSEIDVLFKEEKNYFLDYLKKHGAN